MVIEYIRYRVPAERTEQFLAAYDTGMAALMRSPYAQHWELTQCVEDPTLFIVRIHWTSIEDHVKRFRGSNEFRAFFAPVKPFFDCIEEMRHYTKRLGTHDPTTT